MNDEFKKRSDEVLKALAILEKEARGKGELIFLGGSAIQASLKKTRRFSVDLDVYYTGEPDELMPALTTAGYDVTKRKSHSPLFNFYTTTKDGVLVKMDFLRIPIPPDYITERKIKGFTVKMPVPEYFMAAKLASLAIGTIGRRSKTEEIDTLKDTYDLHCLAQEFNPNPEIIDAAFREITRQQNHLRNTTHTPSDAYEAARKTLRELATLAKNPKISPQTLHNFDGYLIGELSPAKLGKFVPGESDPHLTRPALATIALHATAYARYIENRKPFTAIRQAEEKSRDPEFINACQNKLLQNGEDPEEIRRLKALAPTALTYLYYSKFPE